MTRLLAASIGLLLLATCAGAPAKGETKRQPIQCGELTCGADEACVNQCECCGVPSSPSEWRSSTRCEPLPPSCLDGSAPDTCRRQIDRPCA